MNIANSLGRLYQNRREKIYWCDERRVQLCQQVCGEFLINMLKNEDDCIDYTMIIDRMAKYSKPRASDISIIVTKAKPYR